MIKIAHIEDSEEDFLVFQRLVGSRYGVSHFSDLSAFLEGQDEYDLIVADLNLPESYGYETIEQLRKAKPLCPVLVLTGIGGPYLTGDIIQALLSAGASNVASKDILSDPHLLVLIEKLLGQIH